MAKKDNIHENAPEPDYAILVGVGGNENINENSLDELCALCGSCNISTVGRVIQNRHDIDVTYYVGKGKVDEIAQLVERTRANVVVFDVELSGSKVRNLEAVLGVPVLDRSKVILDIFAQRAASMEGKLQVELAQLRYNLPRLVGSGGRLAQMKNSVGMRGPGEKKLELDKRKIRDEIAILEERLRKVSGNRDVNRKQAARAGLPRVCLVGYTNSGKSTLMNALAKTGVLAEDKLFATLDAKTARVYLGTMRRMTNEANETNFGKIDSNLNSPHSPDSSFLSFREGLQVLLTDTVGFIEKLPHEFIRAFESTLDEARDADLLLHVVDVSNPQHERQIAVVNEVLKKIGAGSAPIILVHNKIDLCAQNYKHPAASRHPSTAEGNSQCAALCVVSALKGIGLEKLKQKIVEVLEKV